MQKTDASAEAVKLVEDIGAWCRVCGDQLELGQEVVVHGGVRCHWDDMHLGVLREQAHRPIERLAGERT